MTAIFTHVRRPVDDADGELPRPAILGGCRSSRRTHSTRAAPCRRRAGRGVRRRPDAAAARRARATTTPPSVARWPTSGGRASGRTPSPCTPVRVPGRPPLACRVGGRRERRPGRRGLRAAGRRAHRVRRGRRPRVRAPWCAVPPGRRRPHPPGQPPARRGRRRWSAAHAGRGRRAAGCGLGDERPAGSARPVPGGAAAPHDRQPAARRRCGSCATGGAGRSCDRCCATSPTAPSRSASWTSPRCAADTAFPHPTARSSAARPADGSTSTRGGRVAGSSSRSTGPVTASGSRSPTTTSARTRSPSADDIVLRIDLVGLRVHESAFMRQVCRGPRTTANVGEDPSSMPKNFTHVRGRWGSTVTTSRGGRRRSGR